MKRFFGIFILATIMLVALISCNSTPSVSDYNDTTSISATIDTTKPVVDSTAVDTSLIK